MQPLVSRRPWYREPWVWFVMAPPLAAVAGGIVTLTLALGDPQADVRDEFVREGLGVYRDDAADAFAARLGLDADLDYDAAAGRIGVELRGDHAHAPELQLRILHPSEPDRDRDLRLRARAKREFVAALPPLPAARWQLELSSPRDGWRLRGRLEPGASHAHLVPDYRTDRE